MPPGAADARGRQKAALAAVVHAKATAPELEAAIAAARDAPGLGPFEAAAVRDAARNFRLASGVPPDLERAIAQHEVKSVQAWVAARKADDFDTYAPLLQEMLDLAKKKAQAMRPAESPYDTMIDVFERGMSADRLSEIFGQIASPLKQILERVLKEKEASGKKVHPALLGGDDWDVKRQAELSKEICQVLGFDMERGRIGELLFYPRFAC